MEIHKHSFYYLLYAVYIYTNMNEQIVKHVFCVYNNKHNFKNSKGKQNYFAFWKATFASC